MYETTKGGFFDLPSHETCRHPAHNFPMGLHIPEGKGYAHVCPGCGESQAATNPKTTYLSVLQHKGG